MIIDKYLSVKLKVISFFSMLLVVFRHAYNLGENVIVAKKECGSFFVQVFISSGLTSIAVPIFFSISGYFLFFNKKQSFKEYLLMLQKRFKSLVIPYLFWSITWFLIYFLKGHYKDYSVSTILNDIFVNPIPLQFWFIRDLFVLVIISPLIYALVKYTKVLIIVVLLLVWYFNILIPLNESIALLFFAIGSYLGINGINLKENKDYSLLLVLLWLLTLLFQTFLIYNSNDNISILELIQNDLLINFLDKIGIIVGIFAVWKIYDLLFSNINITNSKWFSLTDFSFFIYAFHLPVLWMVPSYIYRFVGNNQFSLLIYIYAPTFLIVVSVLLAKNLKKYMPFFFGIITGGR